MTKDLRILGDEIDLKKVILVDNSAYNYLNQVRNGVPILSYFGTDWADRELYKLKDYLQMLAKDDNLPFHNSNQFNFSGLKYVSSFLEAFDVILNDVIV